MAPPRDPERVEAAPAQAVPRDAVPRHAVPRDAVPRLVTGAVLRHDRVRDEEQLLLPERVVRLNPTSAAILRRCDGTRTVADIIADLEAAYRPPSPPRAPCVAPVGEPPCVPDGTTNGRQSASIAADVSRFLDDLAGKGWLGW